MIRTGREKDTARCSDENTGDGLEWTPKEEHNLGRNIQWCIFVIVHVFCTNKKYIHTLYKTTLGRNECKEAQCRIIWRITIDALIPHREYSTARLNHWKVLLEINNATFLITEK